MESRKPGRHEHIYSESFRAVSQWLVSVSSRSQYVDSLEANRSTKGLRKMETMATRVVPVSSLSDILE